jgi:hypothetical protein
MKTQHIVVMVLATVATVYIGTGVITRSVGVAGRIGRLVDEASAEAGGEQDDLGQLIDDLAATTAEAEAVSLSRDPMVPKTKPTKTSTQPTTPEKPALPGVSVTAVIIDDNPMAVLRTGGRSITVEEGDTVNGGQVVEIRSDGVVIEYEDESRTYPYPSGN